MPKTKSPTREELTAELHDLHHRLRRAKADLADAVNDSRMREQLELLADEVRFGLLSATPEQMSRLIGNIAKGYDWREGAWK